MNTPAFPSHGSMGEVAHEGMTLRDYFAATVSTESLCAIRVQADREALARRGQPDDYATGLGGLDSIRFNLDVEAGLRYLYADAMLKARQA